MSDPDARSELEQKLDDISNAVSGGRLTDAEHMLATLPALRNASQAEQQRAALLVITLAVFGFGDMARAGRLNAALPSGFRPDLRYRLALRQNDWRLAKTIRSQPDLPEDIRRDFYWSASHRMLWSNRRACGLRLYDNRVRARNFTRLLPSWLHHEPFRKGGEERPFVVIEQGIGDALVHLGQFIKMRTRTDHVFLGLPPMRDVIKRLEPDARFVDLSDPSAQAEWAGTTVHLAADYMVAGYLAQGTLRADAPLFARAGRRAGRALFGLSWRGGSGQNRRDERTVALPFLLDLLPEDGAYVVLQHDLTEEERALIQRYPNVMEPHMVLQGAGAGLLDLVSELAGVISVDNTILHVAGATNTPILALMNPRFHWYFMPDGAVSQIYPGAQTHAIGEVRPTDIRAFMAEASAQAPAIIPRKTPPPVLVAAPPRSRTSMVMGALHAAGLWTGQTIAPTPDNPRGFFENRSIREELLKPGLAHAGYDPLGVRYLPPRSFDAPWPGLSDEVTDRARSEGWDGQSAWGVKDPKLLLVWRQWDAAFPGALWLLPRRNDAEIIASCLRTGFMARHSRQPGFWKSFVAAYRAREAELQQSVSACFVVEVDRWRQGEVAPELAQTLSARGLDVERLITFSTAGLP